MNAPPLTPPPSHRSRKENFDPSPHRPALSPLRLRGRVLFSSPKNLHHPYTPAALPRRIPSSAQVARPARSILKRSSYPLYPSLDTTMAAPAIRQNRHTTPEPKDVNPLRCETLILSPLSCIVASLSSSVDEAAFTALSLKDLIEAWTVIFMRLRVHFPSEDHDVDKLEALRPIRENLNKFLNALVRDVLRALVDPVERNTSGDEDTDDSSQGNYGESDDESSKPPRRTGLTETEVTYARDLFMLCGAALKVLSLIFWVPQLYTMIDDARLRSLLETVLRILEMKTLPTPNPRKTFTLASAILQVQRLPENIVSPYAAEICNVIGRGLRGELGREGKKGATHECLSALQTIADTAYPEFHQYLEELFPSLLALLLAAQTPALRFKAALTFGSFGQLCVDTPNESLARRVLQSCTALAYVLEAAFDAGGNEASWGITVLSAVIACAGYRIHAHKRWMRCIMHCLNTGLNAKRDPGLKLISRALWGMLVFVWEQGHTLGLEQYAADEEYGSMIRQVKVDASGRLIAACQPALMNHPVGIACVGAFIGDGSDQEAATVGVQVLQLMLANNIQFCLDIFFRLLSTFDSMVTETQPKEDETPFSWDHRKLSCAALLAGAALYSGESVPKTYSATARGILANDCIQICDIRPLDGEEIRTHWALIMNCWRDVLKHGLCLANLSNGRTVQSLWFILLTARSSVDRLPSELDVLASQILEQLLHFSSKPSLSWGNALTVGTRDDRYCRVAVPCSLFSTVTSVFPAGSKSAFLPPSFALKLLRGAVAHADYTAVRAAWCGFVEQIVAYAFEACDGAAEMCAFIRDGLREEETAMKGEGVWAAVWDCAASVAGEKEADMRWQDILAILQCAPERNWTNLKDSWRILAERIVKLASTKSSSVLAQALQHLGTSLKSERLSPGARLGASSIVIDLLSENSSAIPHDKEATFSELFVFISNLLDCNDPSSRAHCVPPLYPEIWELIRSVERLFRATPASLVISRLSTLRTGILTWLTVDGDVLTKEQYDQYPASLYSTILECLCANEIEPSSANLVTISPFLATGFNRITHALVGPNAFLAFWMTKFNPVIHSLQKNGLRYPEELKVCLRYYVLQGADESFAPGLSLGLGETATTQPTNTDNVVPETVQNQPQATELASGENFTPNNVHAEKPIMLEGENHAMTLNVPRALQLTVRADTSPESPAGVLEEEDIELAEEEAVYISLSQGEITVTPQQPHAALPDEISLEEINDFDTARFIEPGDILGLSDSDRLFDSSSETFPDLHTVMSVGQRSEGYIKLCDRSPIRPASSLESVNQEGVASSISRVPSTPTPRTPPAMAGPSKKRTRDQNDSLPHKRYRSAETVPAEPIAINLASSFVSGPKSILSSSPDGSTSAALATAPRSLQKGKHSSHIISGPPSRTRSGRKRIIEVLVPARVKAVRTEAAATEKPAAPSQPSPVSRHLKRTRSVSRLLSDESSPVLPVKRKRSANQRPPPLHVETSVVQMTSDPSLDYLSSDDPIEYSRSGLMDTPEAVLRGPSLPGLGDTVWSPALQKANADDNPSSEDSIVVHSSPIRGHADRRLSRTSSLAASVASGPDVSRAPSEHFLDGIQQAFGNVGVVTSLASDQLRRLREMIGVVSGRLDDALDRS